MHFLRQIKARLGANLPDRILRALYLRVQRPIQERLGLTRARSRYGIWMAPRWEDATFRFCIEAEYGFFFSRFLRAQDRDFVFIDVGANQGLYSLVAAQNRFCRRAIGFEPVDETFQVFQRNIRLNGVSDKVVALKLGLSGQEGVFRIHKKPGHSGVASLHNSFDEGGDVEEITLATVSVLDPLLPADLPLIVKIDTEGHEQVVIEALARSAIADRVAAVFYEVDTSWSDPEALEAVLAGMGLSRFQRVGSRTHYDELATRA